MGTRIILPSGGQTTDESLVTWWYKKVGDAVRLGEPLFSVETDKATLDIESCAEGVLLAIYHDVDETVSTGTLMAYVGMAGESLPDDRGPEKSMATSAVAEPVNLSANANPQALGAVLASPAARKLAKDNNLPLSAAALANSGHPLKKADVAEALQRQPNSTDDAFIVMDLSANRRAVAQRMAQSVAAAPQFSVSIDVDMDRAISLRTALNNNIAGKGLADAKISFNDILMKCACSALKLHPKINSSMDNGRIKLWKSIHFGLAVSLEDGLVVPVVHHAEAKTIAEISRCNAENVAKARAGALRQEDITGGTITLSNLGMFGVSGFTAILNPPESCILAAGSIEEKPVIKQGAICIGHSMNISATFDHRIIDGAAGAAFLRDFKLRLENPEDWLV